MSRLALAVARDRPGLPLPAETSRIGYEGLSILYQTAPLDVHSPSVESLQAFASTMDALHERETILPLRFGSLHQTDEDLKTLLRVRLTDWRDLLDGVEGCVEMGLRVLLDAPKTPRTTANSTSTDPSRTDKPGLAYLSARRAVMAQQAASREEVARVEKSISEAFEGLYRRKLVEEPGPGRDRLLSLVYLVPRNDMIAFRERCGELFDRNLGKILVTGPWPPYHFASPIA